MSPLMLAALIAFATGLVYCLSEHDWAWLCGFYLAIGAGTYFGTETLAPGAFESMAASVRSALAV